MNERPRLPLAWFGAVALLALITVLAACTSC